MQFLVPLQHRVIVDLRDRDFLDFFGNPASFAVVPPPDTFGLCTPDESDTAVFLWEAKFPGDDETE